LRRQRKVSAAPHRGNANRPTRKQGKANAPGEQKRRNTNRKQGKANAAGKTFQPG
jgi:general secretion pathway protein K